MIIFNNWQISVTGLIARQYDNLSRRIDVEGDLPAAITWPELPSVTKADPDPVDTAVDTMLGGETA